MDKIVKNYCKLLGFLLLVVSHVGAEGLDSSKAALEARTSDSNIPMYKGKPITKIADLPPRLQKIIKRCLDPEYQKKIQAKAQLYAKKYGHPSFYRRFTHPRATYREKVHKFNNTLIYQGSLADISKEAANKIGNVHVGLYRGDLLKLGFAVGNAVHQEFYHSAINSMLAEELLQSTIETVRAGKSNIREFVSLKKMIKNPQFQRRLTRAALAQMALDYGETHFTSQVGTPFTPFNSGSSSEEKPIALSNILMPLLKTHLRQGGIAEAGLDVAIDWLKNNRWISSADETMICIALKTIIFELILLNIYTNDFALPALHRFIADHDDQIAAMIQQPDAKRQEQLFQSLKRPLLRELNHTKSRWMRESSDARAALTLVMHIILNAKTLWKVAKLLKKAYEANYNSDQIKTT